MLVDVVCMRKDGAKLQSSVTRAAVPVRGQLAIETRLWRQSWCPHKSMEPTTLARLTRESKDVLPSLHHAHVRTLRDDEFVVVGIETVGETYRPLEWPQAWWCRRTVVAHEGQAVQS